MSHSCTPNPIEDDKYFSFNPSKYNVDLIVKEYIYISQMIVRQNIKISNHSFDFIFIID